MSEQPRSDFSPIRLPLSALGGGTRGFLQDSRFTRGIVPAATVPEPMHEEEDPVARAFADGYAQGADDARTALMAEMAEADAARHQIETTLARMDEDASRLFEERLRETVKALCEAVIAPAAIDAEGLARRVATAAGMFARASDERVIRLHPEDLALVHARLPEEWHCEPDPSLERGSVRVEGPQGGVEDGPVQWRAAIEEALRAC
ncbi:FliH/SctL family protein [Novosphingobium cyanobacteriorum]|uniref:Flagellar assembly protein FliH n=1 Tax=Novosphingobium cyanobacteriorum TaxID=3024215 RepID=A0ABT6CK61_9SPHN|nr:FliH/SctL family protein [Novosphingobium cyanobacteriorum]MDF8334282.1 FliH/SctL family protein [Novosphingobium cyanobacteriorum]